MIRTKTSWLAIAFAILIALCLLGFNEAKLSPTVWWSWLLPALFLFALWKYRLRIWLSQRGHPIMSLEEFDSAKPMAYWWLGMYFSLVGGFFAAMILSQYYGYRIPLATILAFFALWWIKMDIWWLMLSHNSVRSEGKP